MLWGACENDSNTGINSPAVRSLSYTLIIEKGDDSTLLALSGPLLGGCGISTTGWKSADGVIKNCVHVTSLLRNGSVPPVFHQKRSVGTSVILIAIAFLVRQGALQAGLTQ